MSCQNCLISPSGEVVFFEYGSHETNIIKHAVYEMLVPSSESFEGMGIVKIEKWATQKGYILVHSSNTSTGYAMLDYKPTETQMNGIKTSYALGHMNEDTYETIMYSIENLVGVLR